MQTLDLWNKHKNTRTKGRCEPNGIPKALITTWWEQLWPDLLKGSGNSRFGGNYTQIDPASEQHDLKPRNSFCFFDIFLLLRSTIEVTIENLSLNKWKTWPVEFYEHCKKCEKTSGGENSNFRGKIGDSKIVEPVNSGDRQIWNFFLINFDIWNVEIRARMRKLWLF